MNNIRVTSFFIFLLALTSCNTTVKENPDKKIIASYSILNDNLSQNPNFDYHSLTIIIDSTLTVHQLHSISDSIIQKNKEHGKDIYISYRITTNTGSILTDTDLYAETEMNSVHYKTAIAYKKKDITLTASQNENILEDYIIIGSWKNEFGSYDMYRKEGVYYLQNRYIDGSGNTEKLSTRKRNGQLTYNVEGDNTEYFIIKQDGLYIYDSFGDLGTIYKNR